MSQFNRRKFLLAGAAVPGAAAITFPTNAVADETGLIEEGLIHA